MAKDAEERIGFEAEMFRRVCGGGREGIATEGVKAAAEASVAVLCTTADGGAALSTAAVSKSGVSFDSLRHRIRGERLQ
jgi:hypothetical protein